MLSVPCHYTSLFTPHCVLLPPPPLWVPSHPSDCLSSNIDVTHHSTLSYPHSLSFLMVSHCIARGILEFLFIGILDIATQQTFFLSISYSVFCIHT